MHGNHRDRHNSNNFPVFLLTLALMASCWLFPQTVTGASEDDPGLDGLVFDPDSGFLEFLEIASQIEAEIRPEGQEAALRPDSDSKDEPRDWTILFYNDCEFAGYDPSVDLASDAYSCANVDVVMMRDRMDGPASFYHLPGGGTQTWLMGIGERDMGASATLQYLLDWGKAQYPADRYMLCLYDHGGGHSGACIDQSCDPMTMLSMDDIQAALAASGGVDIIAFTAPCIMGAVESIYELRDCVDIYVGSQDLAGFAQWHGTFHAICDKLALGDAVPTEEVASLMIQLVEENTYWPDPWDVMHAISTDDIGAVATAVENLAMYLNYNAAGLNTEITSARAAAWEMGQAYYDSFTRVDLHDLAFQLGLAISDPAVDPLVQAVMDAVEATVVAEFQGGNQARSHGMSVYFPALEAEYYDSYETAALDWADSFHWDEFLYSFWGGAPVAVGEFPGAADLLAGNGPNPFGNSTKISFRMPDAGAVSVRVFDLAGRHVRTLCAESMSSGPQSLLWDGCDSVGREAPSGTYFYRIDAGGRTAMRRMVLVR